MKAFLSIKYHEDHCNKKRIEAISSALEKSGLAATCIARDIENWGRTRFEPAELMRRTFAEIAASDLVIVDLTEKGVGVGVEAGYAHARRIPIITIAERGSDISATLQGISREVFLYDEFAELEERFTRWLSLNLH